jgi:serine/threonine protein kinase
MVGSTVGHYQITRTLGVGGMGVVYEAVDPQRDCRAALKFVVEELASDADATRRLQRQAQTMARVHHPNICQVYEIGGHNGAVFVAMEFVDGPNLRQYMSEHALTKSELIDVALQVTRALDAAHSAGILHRDVKPDNIVIGSGGQVKVLDFGLARRFMLPGSTEDVPAGSTILGRPIGTINYMAPERILQMPLDPRCDLFSLGVIIYEMATGRLPFAGESPVEMVTSILEKDPTPLTDVARDVPRPLERLVFRLLAKRAADRYSSAAELIDALIDLESNRSKPAHRLRKRSRGEH